MQSSSFANDDSNFATVPTAPNGSNGFEFQDWACDDFNLLDFVGEDKDNGFDLKEEPSDYNLSDEEAKKDLMYSTWQYNELLANDPNYNQMAFTGQKNGFVAQQQPNGLNQLADRAYQQQQVYGDQTNLDQTQLPSTSGGMAPPIKEEFPEFATQLFDTSDIHRDHRSQSTTSGTSTNASYQDSMHGQGLHYEPTIKPRKYRLKPEQEKLNPVYRIKREKNNDAVRRSRDKAKRLQMEKDARLAFLENETINNKRQIMQLEQRNQMLEQQYIRLKQVCRCGAISGRQP
jgi:hypothetical protein